MAKQQTAQPNPTEQPSPEQVAPIEHPRPAEGGSYVRHPDGRLELVDPPAAAETEKQES